MQHTAKAGYLSGNRKGCMKGTRRDILSRLENWSKDEQDKQVFWLNGLAGTGKSTIAQTFAEMSFADGKLGASFFCSRDFEDRKNLQSILPTLAFQLAHQYPTFRQWLLPVLRVNPDIGQESLDSQMKKLIVGPFQKTQSPALIIIDECQDLEAASTLLTVLSLYVETIPLIKFFITGRPEPQIRAGFRLKPLWPHTDILKLHDVEHSIVGGDIKLFLKTQLSNIAKNRSNCNLAEDWPSSQDVEILCKKAAGFFIFASTVVKFVDSQYHPPDERLALIVSLPQDTSHEGKSGVDLLYTQVLKQAFYDADEELYSHFKSVVGAIVLVFNPLSINSLSHLLQNCGTPHRISSTLRPLHSLLLIPEDMKNPVRTFHKSFPDFLMDSERCTDPQFFIDSSIHHREITLSCLHVMKEKLRKNICVLDDFVFLSEVEDLPERRAVHIGDVLQYACCSWTNHLIGITKSDLEIEQVHKAIDGFSQPVSCSGLRSLALWGTSIWVFMPSMGCSNGTNW